MRGGTDLSLFLRFAVYQLKYELGGAKKDCGLEWLGEEKTVGVVIDAINARDRCERNAVE